MKSKISDPPHHYAVSATAEPGGDITMSSPGLDDVDVAPPAEFGGPGNRWSPETLLAGAVVNCLILSFRAIASASRFDWVSLSADQALDKAETHCLITNSLSGSSHLEATIEFAA